MGRDSLRTLTALLPRLEKRWVFRLRPDETEAVGLSTGFVSVVVVKVGLKFVQANDILLLDWDDLGLYSGTSTGKLLFELSNSPLIGGTDGGNELLEVFECLNSLFDGEEPSRKNDALPC